MSIWTRKPKKPAPLDPSERPAIPLPAETYIDAEVEKLAAQRMNHWLDQAYEDFVKRGGLDNLTGLGKPLVVPTGDPLATVLKNAKAAPPWIMLRNEIKLSLEYTLSLIDRGAAENEVTEQIRSINEKIVQMNVTAPSMTLHRRKITPDNIREQYEKWL